VSRYQKSKTSLDFTEARDSEWQWLQLDRIIIIIVIIYSLKIGAGQQGRISGTYNCPQYKIKCRNIKYKRITENTITT